MHRLHDLPVVLLFLLTVGGTAALGIATAYVARRTRLVRKRDRDAAGMLHAFTTLLYAVLLGWTVYAVYERHVAAQNAVWREANAAGDLYQTLEGLDSPMRTPLQAQVRVYLRLVAEQEWPALRRGENDASASRLVDQLEHRVVVLPAAAPNQESLRAALQDRIADLVAARESRIAQSAQRLDGLLWGLILIGGLVALAFGALLPFRSARAHSALNGAVGAMLGLMLFLLLALGHPFHGEAGVSTGAYEQVLGSL